MSQPEHSFSWEELMAYVDGQLQPDEVSRVTEHLEKCPECATVVNEAKRLSEQMAAWQLEESPERVTNFVMTALRQPSGNNRPRLRLGGFWTRGRVWAYGLIGVFATLLLLVFAATPSLLRSRQAAPSAAREEGQQGQQGQTSSTAVPSSPMVIRNVRLTLITKEFDTARARIDALMQQTKGYIDLLTVKSDPGSARRLSATLRMPANQVDVGLAELKKLGRLTDESQNSSDITSQYVDLTARLSNARNSEQRLLALLRQLAANLKDVVEMEREIASVRESIERMEAQRKDLDNRVQFATIQLELAEEYHAQLEPPAPDTGTEIRNAFVDGIRSASESVVDTALFLLRYGPVLLIWLIALGPFALLLWRRTGAFRTNAK